MSQARKDTESNKGLNFDIYHNVFREKFGTNFEFYKKDSSPRYLIINDKIDYDKKDIVNDFYNKKLIEIKLNRVIKSDYYYNGINGRNGKIEDKPNRKTMIYCEPFSIDKEIPIFGDILYESMIRDIKNVTSEMYSFFQVLYNQVNNLNFYETLPDYFFLSKIKNSIVLNVELLSKYEFLKQYDLRMIELNRTLKCGGNYANLTNIIYKIDEKIKDINRINRIKTACNHYKSKGYNQLRVPRIKIEMIRIN